MRRTGAILRLLPVVLVLHALTSVSFACDCSGDPPGSPECYTCYHGFWGLINGYDCGGDGDCSSFGGCRKECEYCMCEYSCTSNQSCVNNQCCSNLGVGCSSNGDCCSGLCSMFTGKCAQCTSTDNCAECEQCDTYGTGECYSILPCPTYTHCSNHQCVADCEETGDFCSFTTPPIDTYYCSHPVNNFACIVPGGICYWEDLEPLHRQAQCVISGCAKVTKPCTVLRPWVCYNGFASWAVPFDVACTCDNTHLAGYDYPIGTRDACPP